MSGWPNLDRADDERLARSLAAGDPSALIQVMDRYAARLYDYCHALLRDQEQAAGALHDALIAAYAHVSVVREPDRFRGWLYALVRNECMRRLRDPARPAERHEAPEVEDVFLNDADVANREEARRLIHSALAALRGREREALDLNLRHGLDPVEVGGVLGLDAQEAADVTGAARARLDDALAAAHLARHGRDCPSVAALADDGPGPLPPPVVRKLVHHIETCPTCLPRRDRTISAARLLQVLPVAMMPTDLRGLVMATATDPSLAPDLAEIAHRAEPFDAWGWPVTVDHAEPPSGGTRRGAPRALWPVLAAVAAVVVIVAGAFFIMPGPSGGGSAAQDKPSGPASVAPDSAEPSESEEPSQTPTPTETATPTPTTTSPTPTPTRTRRPSRTPTPTPTRTKPRTGTLRVMGGGCTISGADGSCSIPVRAVGGSVTWSVSAPDPVNGGGGSTLAPGQGSAATFTLKSCDTPSGSVTVTFSPSGESRQVSWECGGG
ncbi:RNA polymerase sigma factor [Actinomadura chibensis]|nr:sigma-70 family RNA polymerase sigma factor [Actinomadura chibensis]